MKLNSCLQKRAAVSRKSLFKAIWLMELCKYSSGAFFLSGAAFLIARFCSLTVPAYFIASGGTLLFLALFLSFFRALHLTPSEEKVAVFLASLVPDGAVALSAAECGNTEFSLSHSPELPPLRYAGKGRLLGTFCGSILFAAGSLLLPVDTGKESLLPGALDLKDETAKFVQGVNALRLSGDEKEKKALQLQKEFEETVMKADPAAPGRSYELLHQLSERLRMEVASEIQSSTRTLQGIAALQQAAEALDRSGKAGVHAQKFSELLKAMGQKNKQIAEALKKGGFDGSCLTQEQLKTLADALGKEKEKLASNLREMQKFLEKESSSGEDLAAAAKELEEFIKENVPGCDDLIESLTNRGDPSSGDGQPQAGEGSQPEGKGAPARGRADAPLEYSGFTPRYGAKHSEKKVRSHLEGKKQTSKLLGRYAVDAEQKEESHTVKAGTLSTEGSRTGFQDQTLHPAHRRAVKRYFDREKK